MTGKTTRQRQAEFVARQLAKGLKLIRIWVKTEHITHLKELVKKLQ